MESTSEHSFEQNRLNLGVDNVVEDFSGAMASVGEVLQKIYDGLNHLDPDEIEVTVGIEIESGSLIKLLADGKGSMSVTLRWSGKSKSANP